MANLKISELPVAAALVGTEKIPAVQSASNVALTPNQIAALLGTWVDWTPIFTGFSDTPTLVTARYCKIGKLVIIQVKMNGTGTSNSTLFRITNAPFTSASIHLQGTLFWLGMDNSAALTVPGRVYIKASDTEIVIEKDIAGTGWTSSGGNKRADFTLIYESA